MQYSNTLMTRFMRPQFAGALSSNAHTTVYQAAVGGKDQGALLQLFIQIDSQTQCISAASFKMYGCGACIATADILCEALIGLNLKQAQSFNTQHIATTLELPTVKMHCTWLATEVLNEITMAWQKDANHIL